MWYLFTNDSASATPDWISNNFSFSVEIPTN
jgi:hypothetical protein